MPFARLFGSPLVRKEEFARWASESAGVDPVHHFHALRACWPYLSFGRQKALDVSPDSAAWLATVGRFSRHRHQLWACRQGADGDVAVLPQGAHALPVEFDIWSPLRNPEAANTLHERGFTLVTVLQGVDRMYHPDLLLRVLHEAMAPRGVLIISASNVARFGNLLGLVRGRGLAVNLDALIGRGATGAARNQPRPRVREYCWQELTGTALRAGFAPVSHHFYNDPADALVASQWDDPIRHAVAPFLRERAQLQSEMILIFRKAGSVSVGLHRARRGVYPLLREAHAKLNVVRRRLRYGKM